MTARERILSIRLMEKAGRQPDFLKQMSVVTVTKNLAKETEKPSKPLIKKED